MKVPKHEKSTPKVVVLDKNKHPLRKYFYLMGLVGFFLFVNTIGNGYNMDDTMVTINHKMTSKGLSAIGEIFTSPYYSDAMGYAYGYRPIVHLSFALEHDIFGEKPGSGHFINVLLFAISVILLFKFLVKLLGEKNVLFAGIATLLFTVHPIHTEVVASLKNRDEILAFLFVIWSGLSALKFIEKGKWISLIGMMLLFTLAMLSKKSVYPMVMVIPIGMILMKEIAVKQLVLIVITLLLPALIGSEFQLNRSCVMIVIPITLISFVYLVANFLREKTDFNMQLILKSWIIPLFSIGIIAGLFMYYEVFWWLLFSLPFLGWLFLVDFPIGIFVLSILSFIIGLEHNSPRFSFISAAISVGYLFYLYFGHLKYKIWLIPTSIYIIYHLFTVPLMESLLLINTIFFFIFVYKHPLIGIIFAFVTTIGTYLITYQVDVYGVSILIFSVLFYINIKCKKSQLYAVVPVLTIVALMLVQIYGDSNYTTENNVQLVSSVHSDDFLKEGRQLEYVENTLVAPHSTSEKIATGFLTLGEYLRLHMYPKELSFYYGYSKVKTVDFKNSLVIISILTHLLLVFLAIWQLKKRPIIAVGVVWYLLSIILFSNWIELVAGMVGERLAFTASAGFCILITALLFWIKPDLSIKKPGVIGVIVAIGMLLFAGRTIVRNSDWKDTMTLMTHDIAHLQNSAQANNMYARTLMNNSISDKSLTPSQKLEMQKTAISHFEKAVGTAPDFFNAQFDLGMASRIAGEQQKAVKAFLRIIEMNPLFVDAYTNLLEVYEIQGENEKYLTTAQQLLEVDESASSFALLARAHFIRKDYEKAKAILLKGLEKYPNDNFLEKNLGVVTTIE